MTDIYEYFKDKPFLSVAEIAVPKQNFVHSRVIDLRTGVAGFGSGESANESQTKATFEMIERSVFQQYTKGKSESSSGWAAHISLGEARKRAALELLERDSIMCAWILKRSPVVLKSIFIEAAEREIKLLMFGDWGGSCVYGAIVEGDQNRKIFVSCAEASEEAAIVKISADAERAVLLLNDSVGISGAELHSHYEHFNKMPHEQIQWLFSGAEIIYEKQPRFSFEDIEVPLWDGSTAWVVCAKSKGVQQIYWGGRHLENINRRRLKKLVSKPYRLNRERHPFL
jgi:hypothetical protein